MEKLTKELEAILVKRFCKDSLIALATVDEGLPQVRTVDAFYDDGAFYVLTYALSGKMQQIGKNPAVAIAGDWFTAHGKAVNLGYFGNAENKVIADKMKAIFAEWIDNGHYNFEDVNTVILAIQLTDGVLIADGARYEIDFTK